jgi:hypothetical protein
MHFDVVQEIMKNPLAIMLALISIPALCSATSTVPFKPREIVVDYGMGRFAKFTFEPSQLDKEIIKSNDDKRRDVFTFEITPKLANEKDKRDLTQPGTRIAQVEFTFSDGRKASVTEADLSGIDIIDVADSEIETLVEEGSWVLSVRIRNQQHIVTRVADDRAVFIFENYKYSKRRLEINNKWNANK